MFCPFRRLVVQILVYFAHFQNQGQMAVCHVVMVTIHAVKFLYTPTFHLGLKITTSCCMIVGCASFENSQI